VSSSSQRAQMAIKDDTSAAPGKRRPRHHFPQGDDKNPELVAALTRGVEPHRTLADAIADGFTGWAAEHLVGEDADARHAEAVLFVATPQCLNSA